MVDFSLPVISPTVVCRGRADAPMDKYQIIGYLPGCAPFETMLVQRKGKPGAQPEPRGPDADLSLDLGTILAIIDLNYFDHSFAS